MAVCAVALWQLWKWRNSILFAEGEDFVKKNRRILSRVFKSFLNFGLAIGIIICFSIGIIGVLFLLKCSRRTGLLFLSLNL